eukprot:gene27466-4769_t
MRTQAASAAPQLFHAPRSLLVARSRRHLTSSRTPRADISRRADFPAASKSDAAALEAEDALRPVADEHLPKLVPAPKAFPRESAHEKKKPAFQVAVWDNLPARRRLTIAAAAALMLSNMDKVNLTLAILPMAHELGWSATTMGLVQSSFFYGYLVMQMPGGALCSKVGGRTVLPVGVSVWSLATFCAPLVSDMLAKSVPKEERASAISTAYGGLHVGSIVGLLAAPPIISTFGWQGVFYIFGAAGLLWYFMFEGLMESLARSDPEMVASLGAPLSAPATAPASQVSIPYRAMLRSRPVQVLAATHFAHNWFHYTMLAWLPTYFVSALSVDLMHAAQTALLPPIAGIIASAATGILTDRLISKGMPTARVRKLAQCTAFLIPSTLLLVACCMPCTPEDSFASITLITLALGFSSFSLGGLYCTHQDLSPKYASTLLGITNVAASIPGIVGVAAVGAIYESTLSWELSLFVPSAVFMTLGAAVYTVAGTHELATTVQVDFEPMTTSPVCFQVDFEAEDNSPFAFERVLAPAQRSWGDACQAVSNATQTMCQLSPTVVPQQAVETRKEIAPKP